MKCRFRVEQSAVQSVGRVSCGTVLFAGARFRAETGAAADATASAPLRTLRMPERAPATDTPNHLADKILQSCFAMGGEHKQVTVLFADVKGTMELAGQLDPEAWQQILEQFLAVLTEGVDRFEGRVNQYTADGIMALFDAPLTQKVHAQRACYAAHPTRDALRDIAAV